jgi:hypothetical protein
MPSLLAIYDAIFTKDRVHILKHPFGIFKCDAMFYQIGLCLLAVPFKPHLPNLVTTKMVLQILAGPSLAQHPRIFTSAAL